MTLFIKFLSLLIVAFLNVSNAQASVVLKDPQCTMELKIISNDDEGMVAEFYDVTSTRFLPDPYCKKFKDKKIRVTALSRIAKARLKGVTFLKLGVQNFSSMSPSGPRMGNHWQIMEMKIGDLEVLWDKYPLLTFEIITD